MYQQRAQVGIAATGDGTEPVLAAAGVLAGHQAEPGGQLPAIGEQAWITHGGHEGIGRQRPDAGDLLHALAALPYGRQVAMPELAGPKVAL